MKILAIIDLLCNEKRKLNMKQHGLTYQEAKSMSKFLSSSLRGFILRYAASEEDSLSTSIVTVGWTRC